MRLNIHLPFLKGELAIDHHSDKGEERPTIIFLHDSLGCIRTWRDFPEELSAYTACNYLVYDRLGYGDSPIDPDAMNRDKNYLEKEADLLLSLIEKLKIARPILFGHSDGGTIALIAASKSLNNIAGLIVEAAHVFVETLTLEGIREVKKDFQTGTLKDRLLKYHGSKVDTVFGSWANTWLSDDFQDWNMESFLPNITCPCLILQGKDDEFGTLDQIESIRSGIKGSAEVMILESVGHSPHKEDRALTLKTTANFINNLIE